MKFTHKPTIVEATQWLKPGDHPWVKQGWKRNNGGVWMYVTAPGKPNLNLGDCFPVNVVVDDDHAYTEVEPGNWIVEQGNDCCEVFTDEMFRENYAQVVHDQQTRSEKEFADAVEHVGARIQYAHEQGFGELGYRPLDTILSKTHFAKGATEATIDGRKSTVDASALPYKVHPDDRVIRVEVCAMFDEGFGEIRAAAEVEKPSFWSVYTRHADHLAEWHSDHATASAATKTSRAIAREYGVKRWVSKVTMKHIISEIKSRTLAPQSANAPQATA